MQMLAGNGERTLRQVADELLEHRRVEFIHEGKLTLVAVPGYSHAEIVRQVGRQFSRQTSVEWYVRSGDFQFDRIDFPERFFVPDIAVAHPPVRSNAECRKNLVMVMEVTSPKSPETVENDFGIKRKHYAKGKVPLYLLVDQEHGVWQLHGLTSDWPIYKIFLEGAYGEPVRLPEPFRFTLPTDRWPAYDPTREPEGQNPPP